MKNLFDEIGIEGIVFLVIALIGIVGLEADAGWSIIAGFIGAGIVYFLKRMNH
jgi:hypothetical protein|tara:strand:+ start:532 stop:690 length:159 start_codon:yes stop_codon:yes gene_type:complete